MISKIYVSKENLRFRITDFHRPNEGGIVHFTRLEYEYLKSQKLTPEEFKVVYMLKMNDYTYDPSPEDPMESKRLAKTYGNKIIGSLRFSDVQPVEEKEVQKPTSKE